MDISTELIKLGIITLASIIVGRFFYNRSSKNINHTESINTAVKTKLPHVIYKNEEINQKRPVSIYNDWVKSQLPDNIPMDIIHECLPGEKYKCYDYFVGLKYYIDGDYGKIPPYLAYEAKNENDLKHRYFYNVTASISNKLELFNRKNEEPKWRYIRKFVKKDKYMYCENTNWQYNAIFDSRKYWMEYHLNLLKTVITEEELKIQIKEYENLINNRYQTPHWKFDCEKFEFIEISDSKEYNWDGIEHPTEDEIIKE